MRLCPPPALLVCLLGRLPVPLLGTAMLRPVPGDDLAAVLVPGDNPTRVLDAMAASGGTWSLLRIIATPIPVLLVRPGDEDWHATLSGLRRARGVLLVTRGSTINDCFSPPPIRKG